MEMNQKNQLNAQTTGNEGKELNDLKSRRVLTELLDQQIDLNEQLAQENSTLIVDQQKLLGLLESKDKVIEEIKASTFSQGGGGLSTERVRHFQNKAEMMADHGWQMLIERILRGSEILRALERRRNITEKMQFFERLYRITNNQVIQEQFMKLERRNAQNQLLRLLAFVRTIGTLRRNRKVWGFTKILNIYMSDTKNKSKYELLSKVFVQRLLEEKKAKEGRIVQKKIRKISTGNSQKGVQKYGIHQKDELDGDQKREKKQSKMSEILKKKVITQTQSIKELIKKGGMSQEQVAEFIQKTQIIVSNIQTSYNQKCAEYDQIFVEKQEIQERLSEIEEMLRDKEEDNSNQRNILLEAEENSRYFEEQLEKYQKQNEELRTHITTLEQIKVEQEENSSRQVQELEHQMLQLRERLKIDQGELESMVEMRNKINELSNEFDLKEEMIQNKNEEIQKLKEQYEEQNNALRDQAEEEKRDWNERLRILQMEYNQVLGKSEIMKQQLQQKEIENQNMKKIQDMQRQNQSIEIDQQNAILMQKVDNLEADKQDLINNLELTVNRLRDLKDNYDDLHQDKEKFKEELGKIQKINSKIHAELDEKSRIIQEQQQAMEKMQLFMSKNNQQDNAKYERIIKEKEEIESNYQQIKGQYQQLQTQNNNLKKMNTDLTKEAIQINEEKIYLNETIEESEAELKKRGNEITALKQNIQKIQQKLEEKTVALQQSTVQSQAFSKLTQEYNEILEENAALKRELLRLDDINKEKELNEVNLQEQLTALLASEESHKEEIKSINANMAVLTREKLNHFKENSSQHHEIQRLKAKNKALKEGHIEYQKQIQEYDEQLQNTYQVLRMMEERVKQNEGKYREQSMEAANEIDVLRNSSMRKRSRSNSQNIKSSSEQQGQDNDLMLIQKIDSLKNQTQKVQK